MLLRVERSGAYASILLERLETGLEDRRERSLLHHTVLGVLRLRRQLDHALARVSDRPLERMQIEVRTALRIGAHALLFLDRVPDFAAVNACVALVAGSSAGKARGFVNAVLRSLARQGRRLLPPEPRPGDTVALALAHSHPDWWVERMVKRVGWDGCLELLEANNRPARTVLCVNTNLVGTDELARRLREEEGVTTEPGRFAPGALRVLTGSVRDSALLRGGLAWVQDEASQLVTWMFEGPLGARVGDLCAAPGGKTMQLAARMRPGGIVVAADRHPGRLRRLARRARDFGLSSIVCLIADTGASGTALRAGFDQLLVDAPCSGTGTLRRHPEIRWRLTEEQLKLLAGQQSRFLAHAAALLRPGGEMVYSVCSEEPEEGEQVIERFLESDPRFRPADPRKGLPAAAHELIGPGGFLRTSPRRHGLDGFFAARLVRSTHR